ncbi:MAG TPA: hypothetical protein VGN76_10960 [Gemmatimonadales bacterium]|nr:hypothetical protein [Gemmatimonadales bacterium]
MDLRSSLATLACLAVVGCSSSTSGTGTPSGPTPQPNPSTPGGPTPSGITYVPVRDAAYALNRHDSLTLQLPGGATQQQLIDRTAYLRVTLVRDPAGYLATIVLDSLQAAVGGVPAVPDSILPARGTRWTATLTPDGKLSALKADRSSTMGDQVGSNLRTLFPALPPGGVRAGMEWTDSTEVPIRADAFDAVEQSLTNYRSMDSDDPNAKKAIKLESSGTYQRTGKGTQYDQKLEMTASGMRTSVHYLNPDGTLASAHGSDSGDMTITVPAVGQTVPVKQSGSYSITSLRPGKR